jgi:selenide,water dikinase
MKIILIGGGHSHAIALKLWGKKPISGVQLTLISDTKKTPYSGMLPGHIAGFYTFKESHIDLVSLAKFAKVEFYLARVIGLNLGTNQVICADGTSLNFDILSIDIGSSPDPSQIKGANQYATPAKPVPKLLKTWNKILATAANYSQKQLNISIVGGGAGGVELALNMHSRLANIFPNKNFNIHIFQRSQQLLPNHNHWVQRKIKEILKAKNIQVYLESNVSEILANQVICESSLKVASDYTFLVTQASAPEWIKNSGLSTDKRGFVLTENTLQSVSHPHIFATGDIATIKNYPRPKAGVFAVRQGKPLWRNLQRMLRDKPLQPYIPQKKYLSLIGTGDKKAIASWSNFGCQSSLLWLWKDYIDRQFISYLT